MKLWRVVATLLSVAALTLVVTHASATNAAPQQSQGCTPGALTRELTNVDAVQQFGCSSTWAYLWATVGVSPHEVGVTELLHYSGGVWSPASRARYCTASQLPSFIYQRACFSN